MRFGQLGLDDAIGLYHDSTALVDEFVPDHEQAVQALSLAAKQQRPVYDVLFVAWPSALAARCFRLTAN